MQKYRITLLIGFLALLPSYQIRDIFQPPQMVIWNIGQGQWATWVQGDQCSHFDVGGEYDQSFKVSRLCADKLNRIYLSHWDWDHIGLLGRFKGKANRICLASPPVGTTTAKKQNLLAGIQPCSTSDRAVFKIYSASPSFLSTKNNKEPAANHLSSVFWLHPNKWLLPGDSTIKEEKHWKTEVPAGTKYLLLGHHGSSTSTSPELLGKLPQVIGAISSARKSRYGHPHKVTIERLAQKKIPLLRTEDWGTLHFYQN